MQLGVDGVFVGSGIFKSSDPLRRARACVLTEEGIASADQRVRYEADVRYSRQGYEVSLELSPSAMNAGALDDLAATSWTSLNVAERKVRSANI